MGKIAAHRTRTGFRAQFEERVWAHGLVANGDVSLTSLAITRTGFLCKGALKKSCCLFPMMQKDRF